MSFFDRHMVYRHTLLLDFLKSRTERKRNCVLPYLSLSIYITIFSINSWLIQGSNTSNKRHGKIPWFPSFSQCYCLPFAFKASSDSTGKCDLSDYLCPGWLSCRLHTNTVLEVVLNFDTLWVCQNSALTGQLKSCGWTEQQIKLDTHILILYSYAHAPLSLWTLIKHMLKTKIIKTWDHYSTAVHQALALLCVRPHATAQVAHSQSMPWFKGTKAWARGVSKEPGVAQLWASLECEVCTQKVWPERQTRAGFPLPQ